MADTPRQVHHSLGWQDERMASVDACDGHWLNGDFILDAEMGPRQCPRCGAWLKLEWIVRAVVVMPPVTPEANDAQK